MKKLKKCKYCGERIGKKDKRCVFCGKSQHNYTAIKAVGVYFACFFLLLTIAVIVFPESSDGSVDCPSWFYLFAYILPAVVTIFCVNSKLRNFLLKRVLKKTNPNNEFHIPRLKKAQEVLAAQLLDEITTNVSLANGTANVGLFVDYYDDAINGFEKLSKLDKVKFQGSPQYDLFRLKDELQLHLCDALNRHKERSILEIHGKYKNSREFQEREYTRFKIQVDELRPRFSEYTGAFADKCLSEIENILEIAPIENYTRLPISAGIQAIDRMEGHEFEAWCADLLRKNCFIHVKVTPPSGDQGVDIVAEKDGIHYAIQCKCYSSDLGNTPVQEVYAGKEMYGCQVGVVMTNRYFTAGAKQLAEKTKVLLWDRDKLIEML